MPSPLVVGIAGGSASGKSTLVAALADALQQRYGWRPAIFVTDRYVDPNAPGAPTFFSPSAGTTMFDWNHPSSVDWPRLLGDLQAQQRRADTPPVIIVEGLMVLHEPTLRDQLDVRLFVELEADIRALRRLIRNMAREGMNNDPVFIANYYCESARVGHARYIEPSRVHADLIVRGDAEWARVEPLLLGVIAERQAQAASSAQPDDLATGG